MREGFVFVPLAERSEQTETAREKDQQSEHSEAREHNHE